MSRPSLSGYLIRTYDIPLNRELEAFDTGADVGDLTLSPQGNYLAAYSRNAGVPSDYSTRIWDWSTRTLIGTVVNETPGVFSADEGLMAFEGETGAMRIWSVTERRELDELPRFDGSSIDFVSDFGFLPDGTALVTVNSFGLVQLWKRHLPTTVAETTGPALPERTHLGAAYPNPANPQVWIPYGLAKDGEARISIFNVAGQLMSRMDLGWRSAGYYTGPSAAYWDGRDIMGHQTSSGIYIAVLESGTVTATSKLMLLK